MIEITLLTDYQGYFGSRYNAVPYRSGLDKKLLCRYFNESGMTLKVSGYAEIDIRDGAVKGRIYLHDSVEDMGYHYKSYIEDVVYALETAGAIVIPGFKYLRAHNNKVFMELLRSTFQSSVLNTLSSCHFGSREEFLKKASNLNYPLVIKGAEDAQGRQVFLGMNPSASVASVSKVSRSRHLINEWKDALRKLKHRGYQKESRFRNKFIVQEFLAGLQHDWKILVFGDIIYILRRGVPEGDFKASGSKFNYAFGSKANPPAGLFEYAYSVFKLFKGPYISLDIAWDGSRFHVLEFQFVSFGSSTQLKSDSYYKRIKGQWIPYTGALDLEYLYAYAIGAHINENILDLK